MQKWEYRVMVRTYNARTKRFDWADEASKGKSSAEVLNALGQQGWELTAAPVLWESIEEENLHYILKRPC